MAALPKVLALPLSMCALVAITLAGGMRTGPAPGPTPGPTPRRTPGPALPPTPAPLQVVWDRRLQDFSNKNIAGLVQPFAWYYDLRTGWEGSQFHTAKTNYLWDYYEWYGRLVMYATSLVNSAYVIEQDEESGTVYWVWTTNAQMTAETIRFDASNQIEWHYCTSAKSQAASLKAADDVHLAGNDALTSELFNRWKSSNITRLMELYTEDSKVFYYDEAKSNNIQVFTGLAAIRNIYENEATLPGNCHPSWKRGDGEDGRDQAICYDMTTEEMEFLIHAYAPKGTHHDGRLPPIIARQLMMKGLGSTLKAMV